MRQSLWLARGPGSPQLHFRSLPQRKRNRLPFAMFFPYCCRMRVV